MLASTGLAETTGKAAADNLRVTSVVAITMFSARLAILISATTSNTASAAIVVPIVITLLARESAGVVVEEHAPWIRRLRQTARVCDLLRTAGASEDHWQSLVLRLATELEAELFVVDRPGLHAWHPDGQPLPTSWWANGLRIPARFPLRARISSGTGSAAGMC